jgi:hypothetical protein
MAQPQTPMTIIPVSQPAQQPAWMRQLMTYSQQPNYRPAATVRQMVQSSVEAVLTGAVLGAAESELKDGLDWNKVPLDLVLFSIAAAGGTIYGSEASQRVADRSLTVYSYRKTKELLNSLRTKVQGETMERPLETRAQYAGETPTTPSEDPILAAAQELGGSEG